MKNVAGVNKSEMIYEVSSIWLVPFIQYEQANDN